MPERKAESDVQRDARERQNINSAMKLVNGEPKQEESTSVAMVAGGSKSDFIDKLQSYSHIEEVEKLSLEGATMLHLAVLQKDYALAEQFMNESFALDVNSPFKDGRTLLHKAIDDGNLEEVVILLRLGAKTDVKDNRQNTAKDLLPDLVNHCARSGNIGAVQQFLTGELATDVNTQSKKDGKTVLHAAVEGGDPEIIDYVMLLKPDLSIKDEKGRPPLFSVVGNMKAFNHIESVCQKFGKEGNEQLTAKYRGVINQYRKLVGIKVTKELLTVDKRGNDITMHSAKCGNEYAVRRFADKGIISTRMNQEGLSVLDLVGSQSFRSEVRTILDFFERRAQRAFNQRKMEYLENVYKIQTQTINGIDKHSSEIGSATIKVKDAVIKSRKEVADLISRLRSRMKHEGVIEYPDFEGPILEESDTATEVDNRPFWKKFLGFEGEDSEYQSTRDVVMSPKISK
ncbi:hypothetical protein SOPP22_15360 [Shewanella sp. OPT22]|nr:hypothetical protein SOPP22_15360 [Shewanella sp. OPT22]